MMIITQELSLKKLYKEKEIVSDGSRFYKEKEIVSDGSRFFCKMFLYRELTIDYLCQLPQQLLDLMSEKREMVKKAKATLENQMACEEFH